MKIRLGFVSNSSSSSFVIGFKGTKAQLKKKLESVFKQPWDENYPIKNSFDFAAPFIEYIEEESSTLKKYMDYNGDDSEDDVDPIVKDLLDRGFKIYTGSIPDDSGEAVDDFLCNSRVHYVDKELYLDKEEGY
jgi:hypothetical protein